MKTSILSIRGICLAVLLLFVGQLGGQPAPFQNRSTITFDDIFGNSEHNARNATTDKCSRLANIFWLDFMLSRFTREIIGVVPDS